ncbi:MAG: 50S ribosomal protein L5 [bacterium]|nr:50S ribosomal protein L5 [bacterium]
MSLVKEQYKNKIIKLMQEKYNYANVMQVPKLVKIVLNRGLGESSTNSKVIEITVDELKKITGQTPVLTKAKKAISNFKIREGQVIGCKVTLRSDNMYDFFTKLINMVLPKIRDFRGVPVNSFDGRGNYTFGIKESFLFPEVNADNVDKIRGYDITIVTSAHTDAEAYDLLSFCGMPFRKK